jgi:hypothetical protein
MMKMIEMEGKWDRRTNFTFFFVHYFWTYILYFYAFPLSSVGRSGRRRRRKFLLPGKAKSERLSQLGMTGSSSSTLLLGSGPAVVGCACELSVKEDEAQAQWQ